MGRGAVLRHVFPSLLAEILPIVLLVSTGCATALNKYAPVTVPISTDPPGATIVISGRDPQLSPSIVEFPRGKGDILIGIEKEGYRPETVILKQAWDKKVWANWALVYGAPLGFFVDLFVTKGAYKLNPESVHLKLREDSQQQKTMVPLTVPAVTILEDRLGDLAEQIAADFKNHGVKRVAILPVEDMAGQNHSPLARYLTGKLTMKMHDLGTATVIERTSLAKVTDELVLTHGGGFRDESLRRVGQFLGADCIVTSVFAELGPHAVEFNVKAIRVETGEIIGIGAILIQKNMVQLAQ